MPGNINFSMFWSIVGRSVPPLVKPSNDWVQGEFQTRIVFKERADAKNALEACLKGFKTRPLAKGDFLTLELLWAW